MSQELNLQEIEVRFLEINTQELLVKLGQAGAEDQGEELLEEIILYDKDLKWRADYRVLRLRKSGTKLTLTYKEHDDTVDGTQEIEFEVSDMQRAELLLERLGYPAYRHQQKRRHTFVLDGVNVEIDTWPRVPTYVELEGESEQALKDVAAKIGLDWSTVVTDNPRKVIEERYDIPVSTMKWFTFDRFE